MKLLPDGKYWDVVHKHNGQIIDFGWRSNIIVDQCRELLAAFMLGASALGVRHLALGRGLVAWDNQPTAPPSPGTQSLVDASPVVINVNDLQMTYLDATGNPSNTVHHRIQISLTLQPGDLPISGDQVFPLREFALFGELNGTAYMIDYVRHPVMNIGANDTLTRRIRLVF